MLGFVFEALDYERLCFVARKTGNPLKFCAEVFFLVLKLLRVPCKFCISSGKFFVFFVKLLGPLVQKLLFLVYTALVSLNFFTALVVLPLLLVSVLNELFSCLKLNLFFESFCFLYGILFNAFGFLFRGGKLKSGINPANSPSKNNSCNGEHDVQNHLVHTNLHCI